MSTPKQKLKALKLTPASENGNSRGCEIDSLPDSSNHADQLIRLNHTGWFTDDQCGERYRGQVWRLIDDAEEYDVPFDVPSRAKRAPIYLAGYVEENEIYACLSCSRGVLDTFEDPQDAARAADSMAERDAETERAYSEQWQAARELDDKIEEKRDALRALREKAHEQTIALKELRTAPIRRASVAMVRGLLSETRDAFTESLAELIELRDERANNSAET